MEGAVTTYQYQYFASERSSGHHCYFSADGSLLVAHTRLYDGTLSDQTKIDGVIMPEKHDDGFCSPAVFCEEIPLLHEYAD